MEIGIQNGYKHCVFTRAISSFIEVNMAKKVANVVNVTTTTKKPKTNTILRLSDEEFDKQVAIRKIENIIKSLREDSMEKLRTANQLENSLKDVMSNKASKYLDLYDLLESCEVMKDKNPF